jgi:hypothetical protein
MACVAVHDRAGGAAPRDVIGDVPVGQVGVVFVSACVHIFHEAGHRLEGLLHGGVI